MDVCFYSKTYNVKIFLKFESLYFVCYSSFSLKLTKDIMKTQIRITYLDKAHI